MLLKSLRQCAVSAGLFRWKEQIHSGIHEPIVSIATFEEAEKRLAPKKWQTRHDKRSFNYRGFLVCGECGLKVTAEVQKGHVYYRCTKSKGVHRCSQPYTREEELEKQIRKALKRIRFDDEYLDLIVDASKEKLKEKERAAAETEDRLLHTLGDVRKRKKSLVDKFIADSISKDVYDERYSELTMEEANLEERIGNVRIAGTDAGKEIEEAVRFVKTAHDLFNRSAPEARRELIETLSSNIGIKDRKVAYFSLNDPFSWLEEDVNVLKAQRSAFERAQEPSFAFTKTKTEACASARSIKLTGVKHVPIKSARSETFHALLTGVKHVPIKSARSETFHALLTEVKHVPIKSVNSETFHTLRAKVKDVRTPSSVKAEDRSAHHNWKRADMQRMKRSILEVRQLYLKRDSELLGTLHLIKEIMKDDFVLPTD